MKNTVGKNKIWEIIKNSKTALSQSDIQSMIHDVCDRVTTYRILGRLEAEGTIHKIVNIDGVIKYAACHTCSSTNHSHNHAHFSCKKCKEVTCIENEKVQIHFGPNYQIEEIQMMVSGICPKCLNS
jgi:Fur family transcriptional regulator, ferric uptake regulator